VGLTEEKGPQIANEGDNNNDRKMGEIGWPRRGGAEGYQTLADHTGATKKSD